MNKIKKLKLKNKINSQNNQLYENNNHQQKYQMRKQNNHYNDTQNK